MEQTDHRTSGPIRMIFNYNNIFFSFFYDDEAACIHRSRGYAMNYVYSGEMVLDNGREQIHVGKGELLIIPGATHVDLYDCRAGVIPFDPIESFFYEYLR